MAGKSRPPRRVSKSIWDYAPCPPSFLPTDEPWADYYRALFPNHATPSSPMAAFKYSSTAIDSARTLWGARERARQQWESASRADDQGLRQHPPVVLWHPDAANAACLGCTWIGGCSSDLAQAAQWAVDHAIEAGGPEIASGTRVPISEANDRADNPLVDPGWCPIRNEPLTSPSRPVRTAASTKRANRQGPPTQKAGSHA